VSGRRPRAKGAAVPDIRACSIWDESGIAPRADVERWLRSSVLIRAGRIQVGLRVLAGRLGDWRRRTGRDILFRDRLARLDRPGECRRLQRGMGVSRLRPGFPPWGRPRRIDAAM